MLEILTVKFEANRKEAEFLANELGVRVGDRCVVTTARGMEMGIVLNGRKVEKESFSNSRIQKALRKATDRDLYLYEKKKDREEHAHRFCLKRIKARKLPMKLSRAEYIFDGSRIIFYFTAERRVDFRHLVKDLARELRTRIEMRQIGTRDEAVLVGGLGCCGRGENCSSSFLKELRSVSVRAAKEQNLDLSPSRLAGMCGRLKCCLNYEIQGGGGGARGNLPCNRRSN